MKVIADGMSIEHHDHLLYRGGRETGIADVAVSPSYKGCISDGYAPDDFPLLDKLRLYLPLYAFPQSKFKSVDGYRHTVTVTNAIWKPYGRNVDGDDKLTIPDAASLSALSPLSILVWARSSATGVAWRGIINKYNAANREWLMGIDGGTPLVRITIYDNDAGPDWINTEYSGSDINDGNWHLLAGTWDGGTASSGLNLYRDAVLQTTTDTQSGGVFADIRDTASDVQVFTRLEDSGYYIGDAGEVWIYEDELSLAEIAHIYNVTKWRYS